MCIRSAEYPIVGRITYMDSIPLRYTVRYTADKIMTTHVFTAVKVKHAPSE